MVNSQQVQMILRGPAMAPPPGIEPNFVDPQSLYQYHVLTIVLTVAISTLALVMRIYTKRCIIRKVGAEDCMSPFLSRAASLELMNAQTHRFWDILCLSATVFPHR